MKIKELHIRFFFISLLTLFAMSFSSCSGEDYAEDTPNDDTSEKRLYFSMRVRTADLEDLDVDVPDYADGCEFEHAVDFTGKSENVIIFFDENYQYKGYSLLEFDYLSAQGGVVTTDADEVVFVGFMSVEYDEAYSMEKYGLLVLNAYDIVTALDQLNERETTVTIKDVLNMVDTSTDTHMAGRSGNYFTMTSAAYLAKGTDGEWKHSILVEIDRDKVFSVRAQAVVQPAVVAYVERMASKFSLKISGADDSTKLHFSPSAGRAQVIVCNYINGQPSYDNRSWTCSVTGWGISKYEPAVHYFRNIVSEKTDVNSYPYSYGTDIYQHLFFNGWNRAADHRCFWAVDLNYQDGNYPKQNRPAVDNPSIDYYGKDGMQPSLAYLSYNELSTDFSELNSNDGVVVLYSTENTFPNDTRQGGLWQHDFAGCELVIGAQIHISSVSETRADYDLFRNKLGIFYPSKTDFATYFITTFNNQLSSQSTMSYRYYDWTNLANNSETKMHSLTIGYSNYKLYYRDQPLTPETMVSLSKFTIPATIEDGDGKVIPWIEGLRIGRRAIDPSTHEEIGNVIPLDISSNDLKSLIYDWIGAFDHFNGGRMTYSVPIRYKASEDKVSASTYRPAIGDYGVVRNTWYRFDLMEIHNLGTPVDDLDQKIIPYKTSLENSIMMEIKAIDWHEFSTTVTLPGAQ